MKLKVCDITNAIEQCIPLSVQEPYDNSGLLIGNPNDEIESALICIDLTHEILNEAKLNHCNLIICHHPPIFSPIKSIVGGMENLLVRAIRSEVNIYALHTGFDLYEYGTSYALALKLGLTNIVPLQAKEMMLKKLAVFVPENYAEIVRNELFANGAGHIGDYSHCSFNVNGTGTFYPEKGSKPFVGEIGKMHSEKEIKIETVFPSYRQGQVIKAMLDAHPYEEVAYDIFNLNNAYLGFGYGAFGKLPKILSANQFLNNVKSLTNNTILRYNNTDLNKYVEKIAVMGGSGAFVIDDAIKAGADVLVTADLKYHDYQLAGNSILLLDIGHYESEVYAKELIKDFLSKKIPNFAFLISETNTNFIRYF